MRLVLVSVWFCVGVVLVLFRVCVGFVFVLFWLCCGCVMVWFGLCFGFVLLCFVLFRFDIVLLCSEFVVGFIVFIVKKEQDLVN